jgi:hypothetical protein
VPLQLLDLPAQAPVDVGDGGVELLLPCDQ